MAVDVHALHVAAIFYLFIFNRASKPFYFIFHWIWRHPCPAVLSVSLSEPEGSDVTGRSPSGLF